MASIEVCLCSDNPQLLAENTAKVYQAGVARIELCSAMESDGLTPSIEAVSIARRNFGKRVGLIAMIRPRAGDFIYTNDEVELMLKQIEQVAYAGADGVVFGGLTLDNQALDLPLLKRLVTTSRQFNLQVGIHRAFDAVDNRQLAIEQLIELGVDRVLTSGTPWEGNLGAMSGLSALSELILWAHNKIEIVVAGGVTPNNAKEIMDKLTLLPSRLSLHTYSSVLVNKCINRSSVEALVNL